MLIALNIFLPFLFSSLFWFIILIISFSISLILMYRYNNQFCCCSSCNNCITLWRQEESQVCSNITLNPQKKKRNKIDDMLFVFRYTFLPVLSFFLWCASIKNYSLPEHYMPIVFWWAFNIFSCKLHDCVDRIMLKL